MKNLFFVLITSISTYSLAADYTNGEILYFQKGCTPCHGIKAQGRHTFPKLANIQDFKLRNKIDAYRADKIKTPQASVMTTYAKNLTESEIEDLVLYLSTYKEEVSDEQYDDSYQEWGDGGS
jgi:cytochrome c553